MDKVYEGNCYGFRLKSSNTENLQDPMIVAISCKCSIHIISFSHPEILWRCYVSHSPDDKTVSTGVHQLTWDHTVSMVLDEASDPEQKPKPVLVPPN